MAWCGSRCKTPLRSRRARARCPSPSRAWRLEEPGRRRLAKPQVVLEQQHRRQRRGEVIDLRFRAFQLLRIGQQVAQQLPRLGLAAELLPRQRGIVGQGGEGAGGSSPRSPPRSWRPPANASARRAFLPARAGAAEPILHVAWFESRCRASPRFCGSAAAGLKMLPCGRGFALGQRHAAQGQAAADILPQRLPFAALPGLKFSSAQQPERLLVSADLVVQAQIRRSSHREGRPARHVSATRAAAWPAVPQSLPELIALVEDARAGGRRERLFVGRPGLGRPPAKVEVADAQVPPDHRVVRIEPGTPLPHRHRLLVAATIVAAGCRGSPVRGRRRARHGRPPPGWRFPPAGRGSNSRATGPLPGVACFRLAWLPNRWCSQPSV